MADRDQPGGRDAGQHGFLLVDMLVTLTVSAFVLVGLTTLGGLLLRAADRSAGIIGRADDLGRIMHGLDGLIGSATRARLDAAPGQPFLMNGDGRHLVFVRPARASGALPGARVVALRVEDGRVTAAEAALPPRLGDLAALRFGPPRVLYAGRASLRFGYVDRPTSEEPGGAPANFWPVGTSMPAAVTIEATDRESGRVLAWSRASIMVDGDPACVVDRLCDAIAPASAAERLAAEQPPRPLGPGAPDARP